MRVPASYMALGPDLYTIGLEMMLGHANAGMGQIFVGRRARRLRARARLRQGARPGRRADLRAPEREVAAVQDVRQVEAARSLARRVALYNAERRAARSQHSIASKIFCTNTAFEVASDALQIFGGNGLSREYPIEKLLRDARASMIEDGCNEVLGIVGGSRL